MSKTVRHIINTSAALMLAAVLCVAFFAGVSCRAPLTCKGLNIVIADSLTNRFVSTDDVKKYIDSEFGEYAGRQIDSIDLRKVEEILDGKSAVMKSEAYTTPDGMLNISLTQRTPIARFMTASGGFYADAEGFIFPLQDSYTSRVHIIDGEIPIRIGRDFKGRLEDGPQKVWLEKVLEVVRYMEGSRTWKDKIVQINVTSGGELVLIPREGNEKFHFGQPDGIAGKFEKMELYYTSIVPAKGGSYYRNVNVEYDGQIVCKK